MLCLSRRKSQRIIIGRKPNQVTVMVIDICGGKVRLGIDAPREVPVHREEVAQRLEQEDLS